MKMEYLTCCHNRNVYATFVEVLPFYNAGTLHMFKHMRNIYLYTDWNLVIFINSIIKIKKCYRMSRNKQYAI